jgi:hypothetical protein
MSYIGVETLLCVVDHGDNKKYLLLVKCQRKLQLSQVDVMKGGHALCKLLGTRKVYEYTFNKIGNYTRQRLNFCEKQSAFNVNHPKIKKESGVKQTLSY